MSHTKAPKTKARPQPTGQPATHLSVSSPVHTSNHPSIHLSIYLPYLALYPQHIHLCIYLAIHLCTVQPYLSLSVPLCLAVSLSVSLSVGLSVCQSVCLSLCSPLSVRCLPAFLSLSNCLYFCHFFLSARPSASLSVCLSVCLSVPLSFRQLLSHQWRCFLTSLGKQTRCVPSAVENDSQEAQVIPKKSRYTARNSQLIGRRIKCISLLNNFLIFFFLQDTLTKLGCSRITHRSIGYSQLIVTLQ